jgi:L,D-transpeptidase catalytic domain/Sporulation and spore germination/Putative peptidoglycan binding domain
MSSAVVGRLVAVTLAAGLALGVADGAGSGAARATGSAKAYFVVGQQLRAVAAPGARADDAIRRLLAGPRAGEITRGMRSFVPNNAKLEVTSRSADTVTVDLGAALARAGNAEARTARLAQIVYTVTSVRGVRSVRVQVAGDVPASNLFPYYDLTRPLTRAEIARPKVKLREPPAPRQRPPSAATRRLQQRLADLGFLAKDHVDGRPGPETTFAVIAFQKWTGLARDGVIGPATTSALATARRPVPIGSGSGRRIEVLLDRQLALLVDDKLVVRTVGVSTGKGVNATPPGSFKIFRKEVKSWSYPFQVWLPWASYFFGGIAFHEYPDVPTAAASHGCVRVPVYDAEFLYRFAPLETPVRVLTSST